MFTNLHDSHISDVYSRLQRFMEITGKEEQVESKREAKKVPRIKRETINKYIRLILLIISVVGVPLLIGQYLPFFRIASSLFLLSLAGIAIITRFAGSKIGILSTMLLLLGISYFHLPHIKMFPFISMPLVIAGSIFFLEGILLSIITSKPKINEQMQKYRVNEKRYLLLIHQLQLSYMFAQKEIKDRDEFLSIASHELKTPLTSMLIQLQTALRNIRTVSLAEFSIENLMKMLIGAEKQTKRLSKIISDLLNVSLITTGRMDLELSKTNITLIVQEAVERFNEGLREDQGKITFTSGEDIVGNFDGIRIEQVITNLLTNALKYGDNKPVEVSLYAQHKIAILNVKDDGIGIENNKQKQIFGLFERGVSSNDIKGLGVGLYITQQIVSAHGGKIQVKSHLGHGSTFIIELPIKE